MPQTTINITVNANVATCQPLIDCGCGPEPCWVLYVIEYLNINGCGATVYPETATGNGEGRFYSQASESLCELLRTGGCSSSIWIDGGGTPPGDLPMPGKSVCEPNWRAVVTGYVNGAEPNDSNYTRRDMSGWQCSPAPAWPDCYTICLNDCIFSHVYSQGFSLLSSNLCTTVTPTGDESCSGPYVSNTNQIGLGMRSCTFASSEVTNNFNWRTSNCMSHGNWQLTVECDVTITTDENGNIVDVDCNGCYWELTLHNGAVPMRKSFTPVCGSILDPTGSYTPVNQGEIFSGASISWCQTP